MIRNKILKMDPTSDRYRICPYCSTPHMVNHLGKDYCSDRCADNHYNEKRRLKKHAEALLIEKKKIEDIEIENSINGSITDQTKIPSQEEDERSKGINKNASVFDKMEVDPINGSVYEILYLESNGVNFRHYSFIVENNGIPLGHTSNFIIIKNYKVERVSKTEVRIIKKINFKN